MQRVELKISVEYRSDGTASKSAVLDAVCNLLLSLDREKLFQNGASYAGYRVELDTTRKRT
jgi:hypothetical protein